MINADNYKHTEITEKIIKAFYKVYNTLGYGFLEKVYENALFFELRAEGLFVEKQHSIKVYYQEQLVGEYYADLIVNNLIIIELKAAENLCEEQLR
jgi:GxxExxY protein